MSVAQIIQNAQRLPLTARLEIIEALSASINQELKQNNLPNTQQKTEPFELVTFDLGQEVHLDRDEIYNERGM